MSYDPGIGRWTEPDPEGYVDGMNPYQFVRSSPVELTDALGLKGEPATQPVDLTRYQVYPGSEGQTTDHGDHLWDKGLNGRSPFDGPRYGNWGGKNWSGGLVPSEHNGQMGDAPPVDSSDELYKAHDEAYDAADKGLADSSGKCPKGKEGDEARQQAADAYAAAIRAANKALVDGLSQLSADSSKWPKPPPPQNEGGAELERITAIWFFNGNSIPDNVKPVRGPSTQP